MKKKSARPASSRAANAEPTPMPIAVPVLIPSLPPFASPSVLAVGSSLLVVVELAVVTVSDAAVEVCVNW
jgi:hypothetical protein